MGAPHDPVLLQETVDFLAPKKGFFVDATAGAGGHSEGLLVRDPELRLLVVDRDPAALALCRARLERFRGRVAFHLGNFTELGEAMDEAGERRALGIVADLGVSSMQIDESGRGFSFRRDGPLDMRMGSTGESAADIVAGADVLELTRIFREYGEERMAHKIARRIVKERESNPILTTRQLATLAEGVVGRGSKIDPATRVFQALRIEVNQELASLSRFLKTAAERLDLEGRLAVLSYHSLEDRIVKNYFRTESSGCQCPPALPVCVCGRERILRILTRRPIRPSATEIHRNPRARSARLRVAERIAVQP